MPNNIQKWQEFLNDHESMTLLKHKDDGYYPICRSIFMIYDGLVLEKIKIDNTEVLATIRHGENINLAHNDPYIIKFVKIMD